MQVLVDSSIWIDFFKNGFNKQLVFLVEEDLIVTNEVILSELIPALNHKKEFLAIESLLALESVPLNIDWELIRKYQMINLKNGINKVGIPDLLIVQQAIENNLTLYSLDKHFKLMREEFEIKLFE